LAFIAKDIPANGTKKYTLLDFENGKALDSINSTKKNYKESKYKGFTFYNADGTGSINFLKFNNYQWVNKNSMYKGLMMALYADGITDSFPPTVDFTALERVNETENGTVLEEHHLFCSMKGCNEVQYIIRQFNGMDVLHLTTIIDKKAIREKESIH